MIRLNIHEAKTHLSRYLEKVVAGEAIILCKRNVPVAEIRPIRQHRERKRPIGLAKGEFKLTPEFFEPPPDEILTVFNGDNV